MSSDMLGTRKRRLAHRAFVVSSHPLCVLAVRNDEQVLCFLDGVAGAVGGVALGWDGATENGEKGSYTTIDLISC